MKVYKRHAHLNDNLIRDNQYNGFLSPATAKKVQRLVGHFCNSTSYTESMQSIAKSSERYYINFITLTLSSKQAHSDNHIKKEMLARFIDQIKKDHRISQYIWRAEKQKNGNLHFHILTNKFIHHSTVRGLWNKIQETNGYLKPFQEKHGHNNPNSTDIHSVRKVRNTLKYISKYITKTDNDSPVKGRIWGCSKSFHLLRSPGKILNNMELDKLAMLVKNKVFKVIREEFYDIILFNKLSELKRHLRSLYDHYIQCMQYYELVPL